MTYQIQFFQATATAIPTLLIAVAVTSKGGDRFARNVENLHGRRLFFELIPIMLSIAGIVSGEIASLIVLATGASQWFQAFLAFVAVTLCLVSLTSTFVTPMFDKLKPREVNAIIWVILVGFIGAIVLIATAIE
jgi:hypothetical protein